MTGVQTCALPIWTLLLYRFRGCCARLWKGKNRWFESFSKAPPVPVHRLVHGGIQLAKPQVWNTRGRPCFAPEPASKFFLCGIQKYAPHPPSRPERALSGGFMGRRGGSAINRIQKIERIIVLFLRCRARGRVGREIFTSRPNFIRGRNQGGHTRPDSPGSRPRCAWKSGYHTGPRF